MTLGERIKIIRKSMQPKMSQEKFAETLGTTRPALAVYEIDRVVPNDAFINLICLKFGVNEKWLRTGEGEMFTQRKDHEEDIETVAKMVEENHYGESMERLLNAFIRFPREQRPAVLELFNKFAENYEEEQRKKKAMQQPPKAPSMGEMLNQTFLETASVHELRNLADEITRIADYREQESTALPLSESCAAKSKAKT